MNVEAENAVMREKARIREGVVKLPVEYGGNDMTGYPEVEDEMTALISRAEVLKILSV